MAKTGRASIAEFVSRGKEQLVYRRTRRVCASKMYHADEVRDFQQVRKGEKVNVSKQELELGVGLIDKLTSEEFIRRITKMSTAFG
jgi:non-homologous end joining protein Ku